MKTKWKEKSEWDGLHMTSSTYIFPFIELHAAPTPLMDKSINSWWVALLIFMLPQDQEYHQSFLP